MTATASLPARAQSTKAWTLSDCIEYARQHNIQIKTQEIALETSEASLEQAKAAQVSERQVERGEQLFAAGSLNPIDALRYE